MSNTPTKAIASTPMAPKPRKTRRRLPKPSKPIIRGIDTGRAKSDLARANFQTRPSAPFDWDADWPNVAVHRGHRSWKTQMAEGQSVLTSIRNEIIAARGKCLSRLCHRIQEDRKRIGMVERPTECYCAWCELEHMPPADKRHRRASMH